MPEETTPEPQQPPAHHTHTYEDDVAKAMNTIDAPVVQEMLATAREREEQERLEVVGRKQRHFYSFFSIVLIILAAAGFGYGVYHYTRLTVSVEQRVPVGVFRNTAPVIVTEATIQELVTGLITDPSLEDGVPLLVPLVTDPTTLTPITKQQFFDFIGAKLTEPFAFVMDTVRLGIMQNKEVNSTFIVLSVQDPQLASKEFLIAEQDIMQLFGAALGIDPSFNTRYVGKTYTGSYLYNLPVRMLTEPDSSGIEHPIVLYGYATGNVIVIATDPGVLKAISDTIIKQSN
jgi:hypothetical protein